MQISSYLEEDDKKQLLNDFYSYFEDGYKFEKFLKEYLIKMGLDEVEVTQSSRDGGIDLIAIRKGVGDFSEIDTTKYHIQAKRYKPNSNKIPPKDVQALRGTLQPGYKGIFITTSFFSEKAKEDALNNSAMPVVLVDGEALITSCIDNEIGFIFKPIFSCQQMDELLGKTIQLKQITTDIIEPINDIDYIEKEITKNDIRARIISVPVSIMKELGEATKAKVLVNNAKEYTFSINKGRNYFASVTDFLREHNLLTPDGVTNPKKTKWFYNREKEIVCINIE